MPERHNVHVHGEPAVDEIGCGLEIPLTGFIVRQRHDTVRLIGYIKRGYGSNVIFETTLVAHLPKTGFRRSMVSLLSQQWEGDQLEFVLN